MFYVFFFQAEDGIRDIGVTGVQTCALPIFAPVKDGVLGKLKSYVGVRGCDLAWRPDGLRLAIVQRGDDCGSDEGQLALIDPKKPAELEILRPGGSPAWAPGNVGKQ